MPKSLPVLDLSAPVCCAPMAASLISDADALDVALRLKALADPTRVKLLSLILAGPTDGLRNADLIGPLGVSDATVSHHLGQLSRAGILTKTRQGTSVYYQVDRSALGALVRTIDPNCC